MYEQEFSAVPVRPPRRGVLPGMRLAAAIPRTTIILVLVFVFFFGAFPLSIMSADPKFKLALGPKEMAQARVISVNDSSGCRDSSAHRVDYRFSVPSGAEYRGATTLCAESPYYSAREGDPIEIRYLSRDPSVNAVVGSAVDTEPPVFVFLFFPVFFVLILSPLYFPQVREVMRARRLYKRAILTTGQVVFVKRRSIVSWPGWPGSTISDVFVSYQQGDGRQAETVASCANDWLVNHLAPGAPVHVLLPMRTKERGVLLEAYLR